MLFQLTNQTLRILPTWLLASFSLDQAIYVDPHGLDGCSGYSATDIQHSWSGLSATLTVRDNACHVFRDDIRKLALTVVYESVNRIHLKITDASEARYEVPESVLPLPAVTPVSSSDATIGFNYTQSPFSFTIYRKSTNEPLFSTGNHPLIFQPQYLRIKTDLPENPNIYGLGEHSNPFRIPPDNTTLTLWNRDAFGIPNGTNLYGSHPVYFEHRTTGTHGVFLRNSNGMDIKLTNTSLEYNLIGGVIDLYFLAGSETDPTEVARQYAQVVGFPAEVPYWSFGFHQCRFGYSDYLNVSNVILRYRDANIPLETMWTDIDYMDRRRIFTVDPEYFPLDKMQEIIAYLHNHGQQYILMTDPAVAHVQDETYGTYSRGNELDVFLKSNNGSESLGVVWPGVVVYPDWFHPRTHDYWLNEFDLFYGKDSGLDIDGSWIDMNEPANFCPFPCNDPFQAAIDQKLPPNRTTSPPDQNSPIFPTADLARRDDLDPPYDINNAAGPLSGNTLSIDVVHANGLKEYDVHNLYGTMMSKVTRDAMLARRPGNKTLVITRSTFAGAGSYVQKWLGDNLSTWEHYRSSIAGMLGFATVYQMPMVGSDICGFGLTTTELLCARWATLGAFYPFMRNHNIDSAPSQEFYIWPSVADAARNAINMRYRLMDYIYTAFHQAKTDGTPVLNPLWFFYPQDSNTFAIDLQFFYGNSILVSPVTAANETYVDAYFPNDTFYDFTSGTALQGNGSTTRFNNIEFTEIPVHIKGGSIIPLRVQGAMTTIELRKQDFEILVAPDRSGEACGQLYFDDGISIEPQSSTLIDFKFQQQTLTMTGTFDYPIGVNLKRVVFLGVNKKPKSIVVSGIPNPTTAYYPDNSTLQVDISQPFTQLLEVSYSYGY